MKASEILERLAELACSPPQQGLLRELAQVVEHLEQKVDHLEQMGYRKDVPESHNQGSHE